MDFEAVRDIDAEPSSSTSSGWVCQCTLLGWGVVPSGWRKGRGVNKGGGGSIGQEWSGKGIKHTVERGEGGEGGGGMERMEDRIIQEE